MRKSLKKAYKPAMDRTRVEMRREANPGPRSPVNAAPQTAWNGMFAESHGCNSNLPVCNR
jgi:hypothetical protein